MRPRYIILHCSDTEDGPTLSWPAITRYHVEHNGWQDNGYHLGIEGYAGQLVLVPGRPPWQMGAHCYAGGRNRDSLGLCVVGKFDHAPPDHHLYHYVIGVLAGLALLYHIPVANIRGHREFEINKTCPGKMWNMDGVRASVATRLVEHGETRLLPL